jgi:hypothetical protein
MSKKRKARVPRQSPPNDETRTAEVATVAWTMCWLTTLLCLAGAVFAALLHRFLVPAGGIDLLGRLLIFGGAVTGLCGLMLLPLVFRLRRKPPPRQIVLFAVAVCLIPLLVVAVVLAK